MSNQIAQQQIESLVQQIESVRVRDSTYQLSYVGRAAQLYNDYYHYYTYGSYLGYIYALSTKSVYMDDFIKQAFEHRNNLKDEIDFIESVCAVTNNYQLLYHFYKERDCQIVRLHNKAFELEVYSRTNSAYLAKYIYTASFSDQYTEDDTNHYINGLFVIGRELPQYLEQISNSKKDKLEHLVSMYNTVQRLSENNLDILKPHLAGSVLNTLDKLFQSEYPIEYAQYQTLRNLGIMPKVSEFLVQVHNETLYISLPELN